MRDIDCLRCKGKMNFISCEKIQLGETGWILGDLPNLIAGSMKFDIYGCPSCGKIEFFWAEEYSSDERISQVTCPKCGRTHDMDYPRCPFCNYSYVNKAR